jgi:hypothetical protein
LLKIKKIMSTRANIIITEKHGEIVEHLIFYRHSDGYRDGVLPTLRKFLDWMNSSKIRNNLQQASGWLILLGAMEYSSIPEYQKPDDDYSSVDIDTIQPPKGLEGRCL